MLQSLVSIVHTFVCHSLLTNTTHPETSVFIRRLQHFVHRGLVLGLDFKPSEVAHLPALNVEVNAAVDSQEAFNLLALCTLSFFADALDPRSYIVPGHLMATEPSLVEGLRANAISLSERREIWIARGCARECVHWFQENFVVLNVFSGVTVDLPTIFMHHVAFNVLRYKHMADTQAILADGGASAMALKDQLESCIYIDDALRTLWLKEHRPVSLEDHEQSDVFSDLLVPDWRDFKITRQVKKAPQATRSVLEMQEFGMRKNDRAYLDAKVGQRCLVVKEDVV